MKPPRKAPSRRQAPEALAAQPGGRAIVTSLEVARAAGVSRATVSRCFTGDGLVRASTRDHVLSVAAALGYSPNLLARMLNKRESDIVAVLTADFRNPFQPALMEALTEGLCTDGLIPLLLKASSVDERADRLIQLALSYRVSAIIITVLSASPAVIKRCIDSHVPVIFLNRLVEDSAAICVATNSERGASRIAEVLVQGGKSRIAMITGKTGTWTNSMRRSGFRRRLDELGFDVMASQPGEFTYDGGLEAASSLLASYSELDAIYACNDAMAFGALDAIRRFPSRSVPDDIAVIGFDDVPLSAWGAYRLSTNSSANRVSDRTCPRHSPPGRQGPRARRPDFPARRLLRPAGDHEAGSTEGGRYRSVRGRQSARSLSMQRPRRRKRLTAACVRWG